MSLYQYHAKRTLGWVAMASLLLTSLPASAAPWNKKKREKERQEIEASREPYHPSGEWEAYFRDGNGDEYAVKQPIEKNEEIDWMFLHFTEWKGVRPVLAVMAVENAVGHTTSSSFLLGWGTRIEGIDMGPVEELVTSSIFGTDRFDLVEREEILGVLSEQDFGNTDRVSLESAAKIGRLLGADYMLFTAINEWTEGKTAMSVVVKSKSTAEVAMSFKMIDTDTARVAFAGTYRAQTGEWALHVPFFGISESSPINYALSACINKAAYHLATALPNRPWQGRVAAVNGDLVTINGGENRGLTVGQVFSILTVGKDVVDPESGEVLGQQSKVIGSVQVTSVEEKFSTAVILEGCKGIKVSDRAEAQAPSQPLGSGSD